MRYRVYILLFFIAGFTLTTAGQTNYASVVTPKFIPKTKTIVYRIGETQLPVKVLQYGDEKKIVYVNLHADETTSLQAATVMLEKEGGTLIKIDNGIKRNIRFRLKGRYYLFDPNRMFSREGARQTLTILGRVNNEAITEVEQFGKRFLELIPSNPSLLIALHNNTDGSFGINSYLPGQEREFDAKQVYADSLQDPDDIFLTTDSLLYAHLASEKYNSIWQDNENARKDGSLSIYCGERNIVYLNCETQHGRKQQYIEMLAYALTHLQKPEPAFTNYSFIVDLSGGTDFETPNSIYFGDDVIGEVFALDNTDPATAMKGRLRLQSGFNLRSNMDLFLFTGSNGSPRIELRVDPTREAQPVDAQTALLPIAVKK